ncbi:MAG: peptide deformylase [Desulfotalea sp.]
MSIKKIYTYPEPILREKTKPITDFDTDFTSLTVDMVDTMYDAPGIGLAAPQIGLAIKLIVVDTTPREDRDDDEARTHLVMANPEIIEAEESQIDEEGCLSLPELTSNVKRHRKIKVKFQDIEGKECNIIAEDRFAVVLQHEIDHINGILFLDHLSALKRNFYKKKVKKWLSN